METAPSLGNNNHAAVALLQVHYSTDVAERGPSSRWVVDLAHR